MKNKIIDITPKRPSEEKALIRSTAVRWTFNDEKLENFRKERTDIIDEYYDVGIRYNGKEYRFNVKDLEKIIPAKDVIDWKEDK